MARRNIAFKSTFNNNTGTVGPAPAGMNAIGFRGTCSNELIEKNIRAGRVWCGLHTDMETSPCYAYYENDYTTGIQEGPCYESILLREWEFSAGVWHHGLRAGEPMHIRHIDECKFALLTTYRPEEPANDRMVFGVFKILPEPHQEQTETVVRAQEPGIELPLNEAEQVPFRDFYTRQGQPIKWGSGLFRYLDDDTVRGVLKRIIQVTANPENQTLARRYLQEL